MRYFSEDADERGPGGLAYVARGMMLKESGFRPALMDAWVERNRVPARAQRVVEQKAGVAAATTANAPYAGSATDHSVLEASFSASLRNRSAFVQTNSVALKCLATFGAEVLRANCAVRLTGVAWAGGV